MPTYKGAQSARAKQASNDCGNAWHDHNKVDVTAALTTADEVVLMEVPAGVDLTRLQWRAGDLDTGTGTLTVNIGYRSLHPDAQEAAAPTYFASASAAFAAAQAGWVDAVFEAKRFQEPVAIVMRPAANANALAATASVWARADGVIRGVV